MYMSKLVLKNLHYCSFSVHKLRYIRRMLCCPRWRIFVYKSVNQKGLDCSGRGLVLEDKTKPSSDLRAVLHSYCFTSQSVDHPKEKKIACTPRFIFFE